MRKSAPIKNDMFIFDARNGSALLASKYLRLTDLLKENRKLGIKTVFCNKPSRKIREWLHGGYVVAMLRDGCPYCIVYTLNKPE